MTKSGIARRDFLAGAAAAATAPLILPAGTLGVGGATPPSDRIGIGVIGCGGFGTGRHTRQHADREDTHVVAVADPNRDRRERVRERVNAWQGEQSSANNHHGCKAYNDFRDLIADENVDAVAVATPEHWHVLPALAAARAGKDVYVEKPMSLTIQEGRVLADEVKRAGVVLQHGAQQRSEHHNGRFRRAVELVRNGRIGAIETVKVILFPGPDGGACTEEDPPPGFDFDLWLGPAPERPFCPELHIQRRGWSGVRDYSGGRISDWGSHHLDIVQWVLDADDTGPERIEGSGTVPEEGPNDTAQTWDITFRYASGHVVEFSDRGEYGRNSITFLGSEGRLTVTRERLEADPPGVLDSEIGPGEFRAPVSEDHVDNWVRAIRTGEEPISPAEAAHRTCTLCHLANICVELGRGLTWDPETERFPDDDEANGLISREMRAPWSLDG